MNRLSPIAILLLCVSLCTQILRADFSNGAGYPEDPSELWSALQTAIENDALNATTYNTGTINYAGYPEVTIKTIRYDLGTLTGTNADGSSKTVSPKISAFYAYPSDASSVNKVPAIVNIHGGGQVPGALDTFLWAARGYAVISINWGAKDLGTTLNYNAGTGAMEFVTLTDGLSLGVAGANYNNTDWDGLSAGFARDITQGTAYNVTDPVINAVHSATEAVDEKTFTDGATLFQHAPHPMNGSFVLNSYAARRAISFLTQQAEVDSTKIGVMGFSMGGITTTVTGTDPRVTTIIPSVGGTAYDYEDYYGLDYPSKALYLWQLPELGLSPAVGDEDNLEWYKCTISQEAYWPLIQVPSLFMNGTNDFNAPFDATPRSINLLPNNVKGLMQTTPHANHRLNTKSTTASVLWMKEHLQEDFTFPSEPTSSLDLTHASGVPVFTVTPDQATAGNTLKSVDVYYGYEYFPLERYWHKAVAVETSPGVWQAACPVNDTSYPLVAYAEVTYDADTAVDIGFFSTSAEYSISSEVQFSNAEDNGVNELTLNGIVPDVARSRVVDDFADDYADWHDYSNLGPGTIDIGTFKLSDLRYTGPLNGVLQFDVTTTGTGNTVNFNGYDGWGTGSTNYRKTVSLPTAGTTSVSIAMNEMVNQTNFSTLTDWDSIVLFQMSATGWNGDLPVISNMRWTGGFYLTNSNEAPAFSSKEMTKAGASVDAAYSDTLAGDATDPEAAAISYTKIAGPAWLSVASSGALTGTPAAGDSGTNKFVVMAKDASGGADFASVEIAVGGGGTPSGGSEEFSTDELAFDGQESDSDLIEGLTPVASSGWTLGLNLLNDGDYGRNFTVAGSQVEGAWASVGSTAEFDLGTGDNGLGYDISSIQSFAAWSGDGFSNQAWTVEVKPVGGTWTTLDTVDYQPNTLNTAGATKVVLAASSGNLASGIEGIRFTSASVTGSANAGAFIWRELDVIGESTASDAPTTSAEVNDASELAYSDDASATDLINGLTPTASSGWILGLNYLNDGAHGRTYADAGSQIEGAWAAVGSSATFDLGSGDNGLGYDLTSIQSIVSWSGGGFSNQAWTVEVKALGGAWSTLDTVDYQPLGDAAGSTKAVLANNGTAIATGIEAVRFTSASVTGTSNSGAFIWRELDVFGTSTTSDGGGGGTTTPIKVILLGGQSNSVGQANGNGAISNAPSVVYTLPTSPKDLFNPQSEIPFYFHDQVSSPALTTLRRGSGGLTPGTPDYFGPEVSFGYDVAETLSGERVAIIKHGENGTSLYGAWFVDNGSGGYLEGASYTNFQTTVSDGLAALEAAGYEPEIAGMLWMQGESDGLDATRATEYQVRLTDFIADIRTKYGAELPFVIGEIGRVFSGYEAPLGVVADAQIAVAAADEKVGIALTTDLTLYDTLHFDGPSTVTLGERMATAFLNIYQGTSSDNTVTGAYSDTDELAYEADVSTTDLLHGLTATGTGWNSGLSQINDGIHGRNFFTAGNVVEGAWGTVGAVAEFNLGTGDYGLGYDVSSIQSIAAYVDPFNNQAWTVEVKPVGGTWETLETVNYQPITESGGVGATKVTLTGDSGDLVSGIEAIRFTTASVAGSSNNGSFVWREVDVFGASTESTPTQEFAEDFESSSPGAFAWSDAAFSVGWAGTSFTSTGLTLDVSVTNSVASSSINNIVDNDNPGPFIGGRYYGSLGRSQVASADTGVSMANGTTYALSFLQYQPKNTAVGARALTVELYDVDTTTVLASEVFAAVSDYNNAETRTLSYTAGSSEAGNNLGLRFTADAVDYDDVSSVDLDENVFYGAAVDNMVITSSIAPASGPQITCVSSTTELEYTADVSASDLLHGLTPSQPGHLYPDPFLKYINPQALNDGVHGATYDSNDPGAVIAASTVVGAIAEYRLGYGANGTGYDITSIQSIAAWAGAGFNNQGWTVDVKPVGGDWELLATVDCQEFDTITVGASKVTVNDPSGTLAAGIERIRFTANSVTNIVNSGSFQWREIDVFGSDSAAESTPTAPAITSMLPDTSIESSYRSNISTKTKLVATFDEAIELGSGNVTIVNLDTNAQTVISLPDAQVSIDTIEASQLVIEPSVELLENTRYAVQLDSSVVTDRSGNNYGGIANNATWTFKTRGEEPIKILCIGDSITVGYTDDLTGDPFNFGYRGHLYNLLNDAGYVFQYVGASDQPYGTTLGTNPTIGDSYKPGFDLRDLDQGYHQAGGGAPIGAISGWLSQSDPDVILLKIGINGISSASPDTLNTLVNEIVTLKPDAHVIVAQIIPYDGDYSNGDPNSKQSKNTDLYNYNVYIRDTLVPTYAANGYKVSTVDMYSMFLTNPSDYTSAPATGRHSNDFNHPWNDAVDGAGYDTMAQQWFNAIEALDLTESYDYWAKDPTLNLPADQLDPEDDADGDNIPNIVEAYFGTDPSSNSVGIENLSTDGTTSSFTHPHNSDLPTGISGSYEWSPDLVNWYAADGVDGPDGGPTVNASTISSGGVTTVTTVSSVEVDDLFLRVAVEQN